MPIEIKNLKGELIEIYPDNSLVGADLSNKKNLAYADFRGMDMRNINLGRAHCRGADFSTADLSGEKTCLVYANCQQAKFLRTNLTNADLERIDIRGADLSTAQLSNARCLAWKYDEHTKFPE